MNGYMVYWAVRGDIGLTPCAQRFDVNEMSKALTFMENLRKDASTSFITMASQTANLVGKSGAAGVTDGKLPSGEDYTYGKKDALSQRTKVYAKTVSADTIEVDMSVEP